MCTLCKPGYYINSEGKCVNFINQIEKIDNCAIHIDNYQFSYYPDYNENSVD